MCDIMQAPASSGTTSSTVSSSASVAAAISPGSSQFQRLKVEDALSYLDQVKLQFGNQPQVYNDFLDIMKEFKSQSIDTPGVISRVSNLFKGHPDLIVGFNTFLPPGFKIEVHGTNEINISGPAQHTHTLQQIAMRHNSAVNAANQSSTPSTSSQPPTSTSQQTRYSTSSSTSPSGGVTSSATGAATSTGASAKPASSRSHAAHQPVEFNHAINYVNKIKNRFQGQPDVYKAFLEILHTYQKEQRGAPQVPLTETEVYAQVSKLFQNQEDLLAEFGQFLPDATSAIHSSVLAVPTKKHSWTSKGSKAGHTRKSSQSTAGNSGQPPAKKPKSSAKDILTEAGKHGNYAEMALFEKVRKALHSQEVYDNFLRCLVLFNEEIVSRQELIHLVQPFLGKFPDLLIQFKTLLGFKEPSGADVSPDTSPPPQFPSKDRVTEFAAEIDFNSLKRHGASYRALPKTFVQPKCSGRTMLCKEVLNDTWVSFPMWSEDSTFQGTRKTQYEECIFRCEDERFELDIVLETNLSTIKLLEAIQKKMSRMNQDEVSKFTLDNRLGGDSEFIHRKAIYRIYGDKAGDIIDSLKKSPSVGLPVVLKRLKGKQEEWLEAQRAFNKSWRENLEKFYLKSLDHQGIHFKTTDTRAMRSKTQISEIENLYDERQEQLSEGKAAPTGPHLSFTFPVEQTVYNDAVSMVIYYMKKASSLSRDEAVKIKYFLIHTLADYCYHNRVELSSDDDLSADSDTDSMEVDQKDPAAADIGPPPKSSSLHPDPPSFYAELDSHVMFTNNVIYVFFRLFQFLCERLNKVHHQALLAIEEEGQMGGLTLQETTAIKLGLKKMPDIQVDQYYPTFLNMAKALMEGNIDCSSYEDTCREMFGVHAYVVFTVDRLVQNIVRQLHAMVADDSCSSVLEQYTCFVEGLSSEGPGYVAMETSYQKKMETSLADENCFKVVMTKGRKLTIELLESEDSSDDNCPESKRWASYVDQFCRVEPIIPVDVVKSLSTRRIFLKRSHRSPSLLSSSEQDKAKMLEEVMTSYDAHGAIEFKLDDRSFRMIPLANSGDYMYRRGTLSRARQVTEAVTKRKHDQFLVWYNRWSDENVSDEDRQSCRNWFLGQSDEQQQPETHTIPED